MADGRLTIEATTEVGELIEELAEVLRGHGLGMVLEAMVRLLAGVAKADGRSAEEALAAVMAAWEEDDVTVKHTKKGWDA